LRGTCSPAARHSRWLAAGEPRTLTSFCGDFLHHLDLEFSLGNQLLQSRILGVELLQPPDVACASCRSSVR
jgi:hypothetical protein